jgi:hypothetical protein
MSAPRHSTIDPHRTSVLCTTVRRRVGERRSATAPAGRHADRARRATVDATGCGRRRDRGRGSARSRRGPVGSKDRVRRCTTELRPERDGRLVADVGSRGAPGSARSSRQARTALGPPGTEHRPAGTGAHPRPEAVLLGPSALIGLERALQRGLLGSTDEPLNENSENRWVRGHRPRVADRPDRPGYGARGSRANVVRRAQRRLAEVLIACPGRTTGPTSPFSTACGQ